jgi:hypothetical protein
MDDSRARRARGPSLIAGAVLVAGLLAVPGTGLASTKFGADVNKNLQPSNANVNGQTCKQADSSLGTGPCTRVAVQFPDGAVQGNTKAPKDGKISRIRLIAAGEGHFAPYVAKAKDINGNGGKAKVTDKGKEINYQGDNSGPPYTVEHFHTHLKVKKGEYLAIKAKRTSMLRCNSGGVRQLLFEPPIDVGDPFDHSDGTDDCELLIQGVYA